MKENIKIALLAVIAVAAIFMAVGQRSQDAANRQQRCLVAESRARQIGALQSPPFGLNGH